MPIYNVHSRSLGKTFRIHSSLEKTPDELKEVIRNRAVELSQTPVPRIPTMAETAFDVAKDIGTKAITPMLSEETIKKSPALSMAAETLPTTTMTVGPVFSQMIPPLARRAKGPEELSAMTSPLAVLSTLGIVGPEISRAIRPLGKKLPQIMGKDYTLNQAQTLAQDLKDLRAGYGSLKENMLSKVGNAQVDAPSLYKTLAKLPETVTKKFEDAIYGIERTSKGAWKSTIGNIDKMREAIGDLLSSKDWIEATKANKGLLRHAFNELGNLMKQTSPEVTSSLDAYANFMKNIYRPSEKILFKSGGIVEKPLRGAVKAGAERTTQQAFEGLAKSVASSRQALKNMIKFTGRERLKDFTKKALLYGGAGGALYGLGKRLVK